MSGSRGCRSVPSCRARIGHRSHPPPGAPWRVPELRSLCVPWVQMWTSVTGTTGASTAARTCSGGTAAAAPRATCSTTSGTSAWVSGGPAWGRCPVPCGVHSVPVGVTLYLWGTSHNSVIPRFRDSIQMRTSAPAPLPVALPPATTPWAASSAFVPRASTSTRPSGAARTWTSARPGAAPAATAAPTRTGGTCAAAPAATSEQDRGKGAASRAFSAGNSRGMWHKESSAFPHPSRDPCASSISCPTSLMPGLVQLPADAL